MTMKKRFCALLLVLVLCLSLVPVAVAAGGTTVVLKIGCNQMAVGTQVVQVDDQNAAVCPIAENNRTLVPVSRIVAAFGGKSTWDGDTNATTFTLNGKTVSHVIGTNTVTTPKGIKTMEVSSKAMNNRTYVPARYILEGLGLDVGYEGTQQLVVVSSNTLNKDGLLDLPEAKALLSAAAHTSGIQIAGAVSRASAEPGYDTASRQGVYLPDLAAASGYLLSAEGDPNNREDCYVNYAADFDADRGEIRTAMEEYCALLSSLPYLEVAQPLTTEWGYTSMGWNYTGTGSVVKGRGSSFSTEEPCDVNFYMEEDGWEVHFWIAEGLQVVDTGDRLSMGGNASAEKVYGERACDAYYYDQGVYYNSSDRKLSAASGRAALLVNGQSCTGTVDFHTESNGEAWAVDKFTITGFHRSDWIEIAFPMNRAQTGDIFTAKSFQRYDEYPYSTTNIKDLWAFAVSSANGSDFVMPMANADNLYDGITVRVLRWDKTGDTVLYFYGKLLLDHQSYQVEGLLAAPNRVAGEEQGSGSSSGSVLDKEDCSACRGSGRCRACGGTGRVRNPMAGTGKWLEQDCTRCSGTGRCRDCYGTGKR